jgi:phosphotransferase system HPr (HPr) family protein
MPEVTLVVKNKEGLHGRPLARFMDMAKQFTSKIEVIKDGKIGSSKSILSLLTLAIFKDSTITLRAEGDDAEKALAVLSDFINNNCGEVE